MDSPYVQVRQGIDLFPTKGDQLLTNLRLRGLHANLKVPYLRGAKSADRCAIARVHGMHLRAHLRDASDLWNGKAGYGQVGNHGYLLEVVHSVRKMGIAQIYYALVLTPLLGRVDGDRGPLRATHSGAEGSGIRDSGCDPESILRGVRIIATLIRDSNIGIRESLCSLKVPSITGEVPEIGGTRGCQLPLRGTPLAAA